MILRAKNGCKKTVIIWTVIVCCFLFAFLFGRPYVKAEYFTIKYGEQFKELYSMTNMIDGVQFYKVVEYDGNNAKVYYVEKGGLTTNYVYFIRQPENDEWEMKTWETVWSERGSASDIAWPYYFKETF